ncbi:MFS transporter [Actinomycetospora sp. NBRC 106378]|nr:MFS transporter [Actinomycetospora sp. NBRC 106378]
MAHVPRDRLVLLVACLAQFMVVLDVSIVNVALPAMREALGFSAVGLQWVVSAYTLAFAGFLLLGGRAADLFGRRRMFLAGLVLFGTASLVGGLADSQGLVLAARAAQGLGGAVLSPATLTILTTTFTEGAARSRALGAWTAIGGVGGAVGGIAGGVLVHFLSWRWIFLVNVPVVVLTAVLARIAVSETRADDRPRLDVGGAVLVTGGLVAFVHGVVTSETAGWAAPLTWGSFVVAAVLLTGFAVLETRIASPLVPLGIFRIRPVSVANGTMALIASAMFAMWYFLSIHMQGVLGFDALTAGLAFLPQSASIVLGSQFSSRMLGRLGTRPLLVGGAFLTAAGFAWFALLTPESTWVGGVLGPGIAVGLGMGVALTPLAGAATSGVDRTRAGLASGLLNTSRQVGGAIGLAVLSTLATARADGLLAVGASPAAAATAGTTRAFAVAAVVVAVAGLVALLLPRSPRTTEDSPAELVTEPVDGATAR